MSKQKSFWPNCCEAMAVSVNTTTAGISRVSLYNNKTKILREAFVYQNYTGKGKDDAKKNKYRIYLNVCPFCERDLRNVYHDAGKVL